MTYSPIQLSNRRALLSALIFFLLILSQSLFAQLKTEIAGIEVSFPQAPSDQFRLSVDRHQIIIDILFYEGLEGQPIQFSIAPEKLEIKYKLGFLQYTIDDSPARPISFIKWTNYSPLKTPVLPSFYSSSKEIHQAHELLGSSSRQALAERVFKQNQYAITQQSLYDQEEMYVRVLNDSVFVKCCPEYIKQANEFMKADKATLDSIEKLHIEFVYLLTVVKAVFDIKGEKREIKILIAKPDR